MDIAGRKVLHLNLHRKWFDMIESGEKPEEYRAMSKYWIKKFMPDGSVGLILVKGKYRKPHEIIICFSNGYSKLRHQFFIECKKIDIGIGKEEWGADQKNQCFIIKLGKKY